MWNITFLAKKVSIQRKREGKQKKERNFVDTICYYDKEKTFVLFEYKNNAARDEKVIQQISDYVRLLKNNTDNSQGKLIEKFYSDNPKNQKIPSWKISDYNWNLIKGVCVSSDFTEGQLGLAYDLGLGIAWVEKYESDIYSIEKDNELEWLKIGEEEIYLPPLPGSNGNKLEPLWIQKLENWVDNEIRPMINKYSFKIRKTGNGKYDCPPSLTNRFLSIIYKNQRDSKPLKIPKVYLVEPSKNLIDQFSLQKKEGTNYYYEIIDKKRNENFQKVFDLINSYLLEKYPNSSITKN